MAENMTVTPEVWPVAADRAGIWLISGHDAWRTGAVPSDSEPHAELESELFARGVADRVALLHSTSWRIDQSGLIVTYMAVIKADDLVRGIWPRALPITLAAIGKVGKPAPHGPTEPPAPSAFHVLMHGLRHLRFLMDWDPREAAAMGEQMQRHLEPLTPALAGMYAA